MASAKRKFVVRPTVGSTFASDTRIEASYADVNKNGDLIFGDYDRYGNGLTSAAFRSGSWERFSEEKES